MKTMKIDENEKMNLTNENRVTFRLSFNITVN